MQVLFTFQDDVVIFDEAHNIERAFADAASFDLSTTTLAASVREVAYALPSS